MTINKTHFTANVAYTTPSGRMHLGHGLGHVLTDTTLRYSALREGKKTFFGFGMHSTGKDIIKIISKLKGSEGLDQILERYNISSTKRDEVLNLPSMDEQVDCLVQEYKKQYQGVLEKLGVAMNYDSFFSTNQAANQAFTQWTLRRLDDTGLIITTEYERPYCPECDDIKHIDKDLSEVSAVGQVNWDKVRIEEGEITGGNFECRLHDGVKIIAKKRSERAIDYANTEMQQLTIDLIEGMKVYPSKYKSDLEGIIKSRLPKPFERKSEGTIGAISPFDSSKKVEALSDSNIYMEFYVISQFVNNNKIDAEQLNDNFFDYVILGKGQAEDVVTSSGIDLNIVNEVRQAIEEVYPVDLSVAGFEHISVHLPFSLFTHAAVLPSEFFFPEYIVTAHITRDGEKMSKSKGNVVYLDDLLELTKEKIEIGLQEETSFDAVRFFLVYYQSLDRDFDWNDDKFFSIGINGIKRYISTIQKSATALDYSEERELTSLDKWLTTFDQRALDNITREMDGRNFRSAMIQLVDIRSKAINRYLSNCEVPNLEIISNFLRNQINMGYPVMPRATESLRDNIFPQEELEWPSSIRENIFPEEYESFEHQFNKGNYEKALSGLVNSTLGKMMGRKEIKKGESVEIVTPTLYQKNVLERQRIPFKKFLDISFSTDPSLEKIEIRKS
ncbi:MAG: class I tRNA ligase family protein [Nanoarchaeota archaeon]|nr:class I tRNA ligase family protein [Nanoarchaeota archaeon]